jgi:hypothetical protein
MPRRVITGSLVSRSVETYWWWTCERGVAGC